MKKPILAKLFENYVLTSASNESKLLHTTSQFGELFEGDMLKLNSIEALYLLQSKKIILMNGKKEVSFEDALKKAKRYDKDILLRFTVYKDLRDKGYIVKTALKFGADFRVYDKGVSVGADHAKWIVFPVYEDARFSWRDFSAKNRVAHSTKKRLLLGIVDSDGDVTYYEVKWEKP